MNSKIPLSKVLEGETVTVEEVTAPGDLRHRLMSFGIKRGSDITVEAMTLGSSTIKIVVQNTKLALRSIEADTIWVKKA
ncbi:MAG: FeoA domain-containing protein [Fibrobacterales bacterium]